MACFSSLVRDCGLDRFNEDAFEEDLDDLVGKRKEIRRTEFVILSFNFLPMPPEVWRNSRRVRLYMIGLRLNKGLYSMSDST